MGILIGLLIILAIEVSLGDKLDKSLATSEPLCDRHEWVERGQGDQTYLVCNKCKYLAYSDDLYEEKE